MRQKDAKRQLVEKEEAKRRLVKEEAKRRLEEAKNKLAKEVEAKRRLVFEEVAKRRKLGEEALGGCRLKKEKAKELIQQKVKEQLASREETMVVEEVAKKDELPASHGLMVSNLPAGTTEGEIVHVFQPLGTVVGVRVIRKPTTYAFVFFSSAEEAEMVRREMEGKVPFTFAKPNRPFDFYGRWLVKWRLHQFCLEQEKLQAAKVAGAP